VLSGSNFDVVNFVPVSDSGITYDVLRTTTPVQPSGVCNCAVATAVSGGPVNDQSNSLNAYTVVTLDPNTLNITLTNEVQGAGSAHLILRLNGVQVADLSALSGGTTINPTNNAIPKRLNGTTFADSCFIDTGTTVTCTEPLIITGSQPQLTLGANGGTGGELGIKGSGSGTFTILPAAATGTGASITAFNTSISTPNGGSASIGLWTADSAAAVLLDNSPARVLIKTGASFAFVAVNGLIGANTGTATFTTTGTTTVGALPAAAAGNVGEIIRVSDSTAVAAEGQTCVGGSTNVALAFSNGSVWKCF